MGEKIVAFSKQLAPPLTPAVKVASPTSANQAYATALTNIPIYYTGAQFKPMPVTPLRQTYSATETALKDKVDDSPYTVSTPQEGPVPITKRSPLGFFTTLSSRLETFTPEAPLTPIKHPTRLRDRKELSEVIKSKAASLDQPQEIPTHSQNLPQPLSQFLPKPQTL